MNTPRDPLLLQELVVAEARSWMDTPYQHGQRCKGAGCDCIGVPGGVGLSLGFPSAIAWAGDPAFKGYGPDPDPAMLHRACDKYLVPIAKNDARLGDIFLMCWERKIRTGEPGGFRLVRDPHHFAIVSSVEPMRIIHAYTAAKKVCETPIDGEWRHGVPWRSLILSAWRYQELAD